MKRIYSLIIFGLLTVGLSAQDGRLWTLQDCIAHALENNISLKQQEIQVKQQEIQLNTSRNSRLPGVSASASENFSFGRGLTADNTYSNTNTTSTGVSLGASVPVFQGLRINNSIKYDELNLKAVTADFQRSRRCQCRRGAGLCADSLQYGASGCGQESGQHRFASGRETLGDGAERQGQQGSGGSAESSAGTEPTV